MSKVAAGIVLYNPELERLKENVSSIYNQVDLIVLIDNNSKNIKYIEKEFSNYKNIIIIKNNVNLGIATALNQAMKICYEEGYHWVLTLDQDSVCPLNLISEYKKYTVLRDVAIISPLIVDRNINNNIKNDMIKNEYDVIDKCITSGSLTNVNIWNKIEGFDDTMFIDLVDFEYCKRISLNGYKIIRVNKTELLHEIGNITQKKFLYREINIMNHSAFRKYYMARNIIYFSRKYKLLNEIFRSPLKILKMILIVILYEDNKLQKLLKIYSGIIDGFKLEIVHYNT